MAGGRVGGQGPLFQRVIWVFVSCCIVVAVWNSFPHDPAGFKAELERKSEQLKGVASEVVDWLPLTADREADSKPVKKPAKQDLQKKPSGQGKKPAQKSTKQTGKQAGKQTGKQAG